MDTQLSRHTRVHIIFLQPNGDRVWLNRVEQRQHPVFGLVTAPVWDDEQKNSKPVSFEFALLLRRHWLEQGRVVHFALIPTGDFVAEDQTDIKAPDSWSREDWFVPTDATGLVGYLVRYCETKDGPQWCLRFNNPLLREQPVFVDYAEGPEAAIAKAKENGRLQFEEPQRHPRFNEIVAAREKAARDVAQAEYVRVHGRPRPGSQNRREQ
jgi:hypothetical protein